MGQNTKKWLRWIILLPISIGIAALAIKLPYLLPDLLGPKGAAYNIEHVVSPLLMTFLSVLSARIVAPNYKFRASIVIASIWLLILAIITAIVITAIKVNGSEIYVLDQGTALIATMIGITIALIISWRIEINERHC